MGALLELGSAYSCVEKCAIKVKRIQLGHSVTRLFKGERGGGMLNLFLGLIIFISLILLVLGLKKRSRLTMFFGGIAFIAPLLYLGFRNWIILLPLVPVISFVVSDLIIRKRNAA